MRQEFNLNMKNPMNHNQIKYLSLLIKIKNIFLNSVIYMYIRIIWALYIFLSFIYTPNFSFNFLFLDPLPGLHRISILEVKSESCKTKNRRFWTMVNLRITGHISKDIQVLPLLELKWDWLPMIRVWSVPLASAVTLTWCLCSRCETTHSIRTSRQFSEDLSLK